MKNLASPVLWVALVLGTQGVMAESMMCGDTVIQDGQLEPVTADQVLAACGEPTTKEPGQWVYAKPGELAKTLRFNDEGNLESISTRFEGN
jgi:hypothetical protein